LSGIVTTYISGYDLYNCVVNDLFVTLDTSGRGMVHILIPVEMMPVLFNCQVKVQ